MVKQAAGVVIAAPRRAPGERVTRRALVYRTIVEAIRGGALAPGTRLPSARQLAAEWGYARGAIDEAFEQLQAEGLLERHTGDGSYVAATAPLPGAPEAPAYRALSAAAQRVLTRFSAYMGKPQRVDAPTVSLVSQPLFPRAPLIEHFPLDAWRRLLARAHAEPQRQQLSYGAAAGLPQLREAIARHLQLARGTACSAQEVLIVNSPMQAIELIVRVLLEPGDTVWIEDPGHRSLVTLFEVLHTQVVGVPLDGQGLDVARGIELAPNAAAVYLHPLTQFPLGQRTGTERRLALLQWAERSGAWLIEANFNDEITLDAAAPEPLRMLDRTGRVLLMGTLEGIMYPSLRIAYLVVPAKLADVFAEMRGLLGDHTNVALQQALAWFIDEGHLSRHLRTLRGVLATSQRVFDEACARHLPRWVRPGPPHGGSYAALHLPPDIDDREVVRAMRTAGVLGIALSSMCVTPGHANGIGIGHAAFAPAVIDESLRVIGAVLRAARAAAVRPPAVPG
jgi:GntR family transcriptional regulator/MocR family aminotransferase